MSADGKDRTAGERKKTLIFNFHAEIWKKHVTKLTFQEYMYRGIALYLCEKRENPQYIVETSKPNTALILNEFANGTEQFKTKINEKEWKRLLKNKKILCKK